MNKAKLDQFVLDIEFLLISVVQGVALAALAAAASDPLSNLQFEYWPYILAAFLIILTFWSQAIVHSLSFIDWPLDLAHNFLYFLASLVEVLAFSHLTDPLKWFVFNFVFVLVAAVLYFVDLKLIQQRKKDFDNTDQRKRLYQHILGEEKKEIKTLLPSGIIFNLLCIGLIVSNPNIFIVQKWHLLLVGLQVLLTIYIITVAVNSFKKRSLLISQCL